MPSDMVASRPDAAEIDYDAWRRRIRADTFRNYHEEMGAALLATQDVAAAANAFQRAVAADPASPTAAVRLVDALRRLNRDADAEAAHREAQARNPDYAVVGNLQLARRFLADCRPVQALPFLEQATALVGNDPGVTVQLAIARLAAGDHAIGPVAADGLTAEQRTDLAETAAKLMNHAYWHGTPEQAAGPIPAALGQIAASLDPDNAAAAVTLGFILLMTWQPDGILELFQRLPAGSAARAHPELSVSVGWSLLLTGRWAEAEDAIRRTLPAVAPVYAEYLTAGLACARSARGDHASAATLLDELLARTPGSFHGHFHRGVLHLASGNPAAALDHAAKALEVGAREQRSLALTLIGQCRQQLGELEKAMSLFQEALEQAGRSTRLVMLDDPWICLNLALAQSAAGETAKAASLFREKVLPYRACLPYMRTTLPNGSQAALDQLMARVGTA